jgi:hypothetical protein
MDGAADDSDQDELAKEPSLASEVMSITSSKGKSKAPVSPDSLSSAAANEDGTASDYSTPATSAVATPNFTTKMENGLM